MTRASPKQQSQSYARAAMSARRTNFVRRTNSVRFSGKEFKSALEHVSEGDIATALGVTKDTAASWKQGRRVPHFDNAMDLANIYPTVEALVRSRLPQEYREFQNSPQFLDAVYRAAEEVIARRFK